MKHCRWCRTEIVPGFESVGGEKIATWIHASGWYSCPRHSETMAEPADERWESVFASVSKPASTGVPSLDALFEENLLVFRVEVVSNQGRCYCVIRASKKELELYPDLYKKVLDAITWSIDIDLDRETQNEDVVELRNT